MGIRANLISRPRPRPLPSAPALSREVKGRGALEATVRSHRSPARFPCGPCGCRGCRQQVALVSCAGDSLTICSERIEDLVGGLGPHKRPWVLVPGLDPRPDVSLQGLHALVDAALQR